MKNIADMSRDELEREIESLQDYFNRCEEIGQGIGSKETVRMRAMTAALGATLSASDALEIVDNYQKSRGYPGLLDTLTAMTNDRFLSAIDMAGRDVAIAGFAAMFAPVGER